MEQLFNNVALSTQDVHNWAIVGSVLVICAGLYFYHRMSDPHVLERAMAKRRKEQAVADVLSAALQDAALAGKIEPSWAKEYNKKVARFFKLPDMEPRVPMRAAKIMAYLRLRDANVINIAGKLSLIRRFRTADKLTRVRTKAKKA